MLLQATKNDKDQNVFTSISYWEFTNHNVTTFECHWQEKEESSFNMWHWQIFYHIRRITFESRNTVKIRQAGTQSISSIYSENWCVVTHKKLKWLRWVIFGIWLHEKSGIDWVEMEGSDKLNFSLLFFFDVFWSGKSFVWILFPT